MSLCPLDTPSNSSYSWTWTENSRIYVYYVYMLLVFITVFHIHGTYSISSHLPPLGYTQFLFSSICELFSSLKFRRLSLKTLETRHAGDTIVALLEQHPEWSHTKFTFEEPILDRTPGSTGVFFNRPVLFFFLRRVFEPLEHWREWWSLKNGYENLRAFPGLVTLNEMVLFSSVDWIDLLD